MLPAQSAFCLRHLHPFTGAHADQVSLELRHHGQHVEQQPADRVGRVMDRSAETEPHIAPGQLIQDVPGVG